MSFSRIASTYLSMSSLLCRRLTEQRSYRRTVMIFGGFGAGVLEPLSRWNLAVPTLCLGVGDEFVEYGAIEEQLEQCGLTPEGVCRAVADRLNALC